VGTIATIIIIVITKKILVTVRDKMMLNAVAPSDFRRGPGIYLHSGINTAIYVYVDMDGDLIFARG
jgi:hypothetical protein